MITKDEYEQQYRVQKGACAICEALNLNGDPLHLDMDADQSRLRGLLCNNCLILVKVGYDQPEVFLKAARYVMQQVRGMHP